MTYYVFFLENRKTHPANNATTFGATRLPYIMHVEIKFSNFENLGFVCSLRILLIILHVCLTVINY